MINLRLIYLFDMIININFRLTQILSNSKEIFCFTISDIKVIYKKIIKKKIRIKILSGRETYCITYSGLSPFNLFLTTHRANFCHVFFRFG